MTPPTFYDIDSNIVFLRETLLQIKPSLPEDMDVTDDFKAVWGLDSLDLVEYIARIEQHYQLAIPDADLPIMVSLQAIMDYLADRQVIMRQN